MKYHINPDGTIPCTNSCGKELMLTHVSFKGDYLWLHTDGSRYCFGGVEDRQACPLPPNDEESMYPEIGSIGETGGEEW